jgi:hypothetical protein
MIPISEPTPLGDIYSKMLGVDRAFDLLLLDNAVKNRLTEGCY